MTLDTNVAFGDTFAIILFVLLTSSLTVKWREEHI
jgi:hypothetical protein